MVPSDSVEVQLNDDDVDSSLGALSSLRKAWEFELKVAYVLCNLNTTSYSKSEIRLSSKNGR